MVATCRLALPTRSALIRNGRGRNKRRGVRETITGGNLGNRGFRQSRRGGTDGLQKAPAFQRFTHAADSLLVVAVACGLMRRSIASVRRIASAFALSSPDTSAGGSSSSVV